MKIVRAQAMGLCFGVRDALDIALTHPTPDRVSIWGELVHNATVQEQLQHRGYSTVAEADRRSLPKTESVLITAHGVSDAERNRLTSSGHTLVDTTCPLVRRAHHAGQALARDGRLVVVIGKPGHVEVKGLVGDLPNAVVVAGPDDVQPLHRDALGVLCQTTCTEEHAAATLAAIRDANPDADIRFVDTICDPTKQRVRAARSLALAVDCAVVVGGRNSNNTRQLASIFEAEGVRTHHVQCAQDIDAQWFDAGDSVGLTAGTSTLDATVDAIEERLRSIAADLQSKGQPPSQP